jgi:hypothetical protein
VPDRHGLGDHAAQGGTDDVGGIAAQRIQHRYGIVGHVLKPVGRGGMTDERLEPARVPGLGKVRREAGITVIKAGYAEPAACEGRRERVRPHQHLHPGAADQQKRLTVRKAERLVGELDGPVSRDLHRGLLG